VRTCAGARTTGSCVCLSVAGARMLTEGGQNATHPVFDLAMTHVEGIMGHFYGQTVPPRTA
jgi:hypothetical protein